MLELLTRATGGRSVGSVGLPIRPAIGAPSPKFRDLRPCGWGLTCPDGVESLRIVGRISGVFGWRVVQPVAGCVRGPTSFRWDACGQGSESAHGGVRRDPRVRLVAAAPLVPQTRRTSREADPGQPVRPTGRGDRRGRGGTEGQDTPRRRRRAGGDPVAAARACRPGRRAGRPVEPAAVVGPAVPGTRPGLCVDRVAGGAAAAEVSDPALVGGRDAGAGPGGGRSLAR